jgi:hypothetical protein
MMTVPVGIGMVLIALAPRDPAGRTGRPSVTAAMLAAS